MLPQKKNSFYSKKSQCWLLKLNNKWWYVRLVNPYSAALLMPNNTYAVGACNNITQTIYISNVLHEQEIKHVLCHELIHAITFSYNIPFSLEEEETIAEMIAERRR